MAMGNSLSLLERAAGALVPEQKIKALLAKETSAARLRDFTKRIEAARLIDGETEQRKNYWGRLSVWATRRLGEIIQDGQQRGEIASRGGDRKSNSRPGSLKLPDLGLTHNQSSRAQQLAAIPVKEIEKHLDEIESKGEVTKAAVLRAAAKQLQKKDPQPVTGWPAGQYRILYADPPWSYNDQRLATVAGGVAVAQYPPMDTETICGLSVPSIALRDSVLFLWATSPLLPDAMRVIDSWGFTYKASFVWDKQRGFNGHYNDVRHELLLVAVRGKCQPQSETLPPSVITEKKTRHSAKPATFRSIIDGLYPHGPRIELFAREAPQGWDVWGNEAISRAS
jgi:N6-adenosine-specific RNA methylase IME4